MGRDDSDGVRSPVDTMRRALDGPVAAVGFTPGRRRQPGDTAARTQAWNRDEWDVALDDGTLCRIYRDRDGRGWFMEGCWD